MPYYIRVDDNGIVQQVSETSGAIPDGQNIIEIAEYMPEIAGMRKVGENYIPVTQPIRKIRQDAFVDRFSAEELNSIVVAADTDRVVQVIRDTLLYLARPHINLDAPKVIQAVNYLKNQGILDGADAAAKEVRAVELLADGQTSEAVGV